MKKILLLLFIPFIFSVQLSAQDAKNNISLQVGLQCENTGTFFLPTVNIKEGDVYEIEDWSLPNSSFPHFLWSSIKGTQFKIENGALDKDVTIMFIISGVNCGTGFYNCGKNGEKLFFNVNLILSIDGVEQPSPYFFKDLKNCILKIPNSINLKDFIDSSGIDSNSKINFFYRSNNLYSSDDIQTIKPELKAGSENSFFEIRLRHFSNIVGMEESSITAVENSENISPLQFGLEQNYPNPFNPSTKINYSLTEGNFVELNVYNILGIKVENILSDFQNAGSHSADFNASGLPSGLYIYELKAGNYSATKKMIYLK